MDIFGIIYKALNKLSKSVTSLRGAVDKKQNKLTYADGSEVTNYKGLKLSMLKGLPFRDTVLIVNDTNENGYGVAVTDKNSGDIVIKVYDHNYTIYIKDPVKDLHHGGNVLMLNLSACLSLKISEFSTTKFNNCMNLTYCGYIDTVDSPTVDLGNYFHNCEKLSDIPDYFVQVPVTSMVSTFSYCKSLTKLPMLDTSLSEDFSQCCYECVMYEIPAWKFSKGVNFFKFCFGADNLISVNLNLPEATNIEYGFFACRKLTTCNINAPKATDCNNIFHSSGIKTVNISTGKQCKMVQAFYTCRNLETVVLSGVFSTLEYAFYECSSLKELPAIQVSYDEFKPTSLDSAFNHTALTKFPILNGYVDFGRSNVRNDFVQEIPRYNTPMSSLNSHLIFETPQLTTVGGFIKMATKIVNFRMCPLLTRDSILNVFNDLFSITSGIETRIIFHEEAYNRLSEEDIAIAVNKRWTVEKSAY